MGMLDARKSSDETRHFDHGHAEFIEFEGQTVARYTFEPGWRWSAHMSARAGTPSCQREHLGYCVSGRMKLRSDEGQMVEIGPGDFISIEPGHDAWVKGDEPCVFIDFATELGEDDASRAPSQSSQRPPSETPLSP